MAHRDPKIININADKPEYDDFQKNCNTHKPDNPGNVPIYIQATNIPVNDRNSGVEFQCDSFYDGQVYNLDYQPWKEGSRDDWACCAYNLTSNLGNQETLFLPKSMKGSNKNILSIYTLESKLREYKNKLIEIDQNLKDARDNINTCENLCGNRSMHINDIPILNPLTTNNNHSYKPATCNETKGATATQLNMTFNINDNSLYTVPTLSTNPKSLVCCGMTKDKTFWIPKSVLGSNSRPNNPIPGFLTQDDIDKCTDEPSKIIMLENSQKEYIDKINNVTTQLVTIGESVAAGTTVYDSCYNHLEDTIDYAQMYHSLNEENLKIKAMIDNIRKIESGAKIEEQSIVSEIYQYIIYVILSVLLVGVCAILLIPAFQKKLGINIKDMVNTQKNALKLRMKRT